MQSTFTQTIKNEARRLGFNLAGVAAPDPPAHGSVYESWLAQGHHAGMEYMNTERSRACRLDPRLVLPECCSILVLAMRHPNPLSFMADAKQQKSGSWPAELTGQVASYAWGKDYHLVLAERMKAMVEFIETQTGKPLNQRCYTDTGPVLERELAQRAGLGWIGRNACLINPRIGSYFLIAEIFMDIELEIDAPFTADRCGTCRWCIEACPTGCILPNRTIDARRCISYLTIENKGDIPENLRPRLRNWIFGCDICQMVCPWNRVERSGYEPAFAPREDIPHPELITESALTPQKFNRKYKDSPLQRARRKGTLRNIIVALGNSRSAEAIPILEKLTQDHESLIRDHAKWALREVQQ